MVAVEELTYTVEHWSDDGNKLIEVLARTANQGVAVIAYKAIRNMRPTHRIRLCQRARIIHDSAELGVKGR